MYVLVTLDALLGDELMMTFPSRRLAERYRANNGIKFSRIEEVYPEVRDFRESVAGEEFLD